MKRILFTLLVFVLCVMLTGCFTSYICWQNVELYSNITLRMPMGWSSFVEEGLIYILNENSEPVMIEFKEVGVSESNKYYKDFVYEDFITSNVNSNGVIYGKAMIRYENNCLQLDYMFCNGIDFIVWDKTLPQDVLVKISKSYNARNM